MYLWDFAVMFIKVAYTKHVLLLNIMFKKYPISITQVCLAIQVFITLQYCN